MLKLIKTGHGSISLPAFFPDATRAVLKGGVDSRDLDQTRLEGLVINTLHLSEMFDHQIPDMHQFMSWHKPIITDSGGFQVMSLIHNNPKRGRLTDQEAIFTNSHNQKVCFTPEQSIKIQLSLGADILICLDDCTKPGAPSREQQQSVERTIAWARRCKDEFTRLTKKSVKKPLLFAVVQGGNDRHLRLECAQALLEIGFDGYCYGGWPVDENRIFLGELLAYTAKLLPDNKPKYAMGVGRPIDIINCFQMGYNLFDCVIPTREARHKKLYIFTQNPKGKKLTQDCYSSIYLQKSIFKYDYSPVSEYCDCLTCQNYTKAYLYHLFKIGDLLAYRLATIHNLRFYTQLLESLAAKKFQL